MNHALDLDRPRSAMRIIGDMGLFADEVLTRIARARSRVDIECFIVRHDRLGRALADALGAAVARGVRCRLLYDSLGSKKTRRSYFNDLRDLGVEVRGYGWLGAFLLGKPAARDHARVVVIDEQVAYTGGHAWGEEWLPAAQGGSGWRDLCCAARGPIVTEFSRLFEQHWRQAGGDLDMRDLDSGSPSSLRLLSDAPVKESLILRSYVDAIDRARQRVWLANAYFFPPPVLLQALVRARQRGVDVKLIVPGVSDLSIILRGGRAQYRRWMAAGLEVWEYQDVVMHSKYVLVDQAWCLVGTFNANAVSVAMAIEVALVGRHPAVLEQVEVELQKDLAHSRRIDQRWLDRRPWTDRVLDRCASALLGLAGRILRREPGPRKLSVAGCEGRI